MWRNRLKNGLLIALAVMVSFGAIGFVSKKQQDKTIGRLFINIENQGGQYFVVEQDIAELIVKKYDPFLFGMEISAINLRNIEETVRGHRFIERAEVHRDLAGNLVVDVKQRRPLARVVRKNGPDQYIADSGKLMPVSDRYTARVVIVEGAFFDQKLKTDLNESETGKALYDLLQFIEQDKFWHAQIAQIKVDADGEITMLPQVGKQSIEFGQPDHKKEKFRKLRIFYEKILPHKGWNAYSRVNVKYEGQLICE
jgi:cell division protein FtsQ